MIWLPDPFANRTRNWGLKVLLFIVKCYDHVMDFDRGIFNPNLQLFKSALSSTHVDLVVIVLEIHLLLT